MGKGDSSAGKLKDYYGSIAGLVCAGPVDELVSIIVDKTTVWQGPLSRTAPGVTNPQVIAVSGYGSVVFYWGTDDQVLNTALTPALSAHPPYRRQCWCVLKDFLFGRERTSAPNVEIVVRRKARQEIVTGSAAALDTQGQANPLTAIVELATDPVFGLGQPADLFEAGSWQAAADTLSAEASRTHISAVVGKAAHFRSIVAELLAYFDGWLRWNDAGSVEAGRFLHNQAPPVFTPDTTLDFHDLIEEASFEAQGWAATSNETLVRFIDRDRAFQDAAARAVSGWNREVVGEPRGKRIECPFITRAQQAADHAAEHARLAAEPSLAGTLTVRAAKAAAIQPGDLFLFTHDAAALSIICRCLAETIPAPDTDRVQLRFENERGLAPVPFQPTALGIGGPGAIAAERIDLFQIVAVPPGFSGGSETKLAVLAARTAPTTVGLHLHLKKADDALFYLLGGQTGWAVTGVLAQDYPADPPVEGNLPPDDDTETLRLNLDPATVPADLERISATQSADAINDANLLVWVFRAAGPHQFEVMTLKAMRVNAGETFYRLKVRRARAGTSQMAFATGDRAFIVYWTDVTLYTHTLFGAYAASGATATFRLQAFNAWGRADLTDPALCPDRTYTFADTYAPQAQWVSVRRNGIPIPDFTEEFALTDEFSLNVLGTDPNGDLVSLAVLARLGQESRTLLAASSPATPSLSRSVTFKPSTLSMGEGDWRLFAVATDGTNRRAEVELTPGGGGDAVQLKLRAAPGAGTTCVMPWATPGEGPSSHYPLTVHLATSTPGATIHYQIVALSGIPGTTWLTYTGPIALPGQRALYAYASKDGLADSFVFAAEYWYERIWGGIPD